MNEVLVDMHFDYIHPAHFDTVEVVHIAVGNAVEVVHIAVGTEVGTEVEVHISFDIGVVVVHMNFDTAGVPLILDH